MLRLGITRNQDSLKQLTELAVSRDITIVPLPLISATALPFDWPQGLDVNKLDWLLFSSANGVRAYLDRLKELGMGMGSDTRICVVGRKTKETVLSYGLTVGFVPSESYGKVMFEELSEKHDLEGKSVLYARGAMVNFDPTAMLVEKGVIYFPVICYDTKIVSVDQSAVSEFCDEDYILFTAPSTVNSYSEQFGKPLAKSIAIGKTTASEMEACGWTASSVMREADVEKVLEYI